MSDVVTMKVLDTFHASNIQADNLVAGDVINVTETDAKHLERQGLAERGGTASKAVNAEAATIDRPDTREELDAERDFVEGKAISAAPANKALAGAENKTTETARTTRRGK